MQRNRSLNSPKVTEVLLRERIAVNRINTLDHPINYIWSNVDMYYLSLTTRALELSVNSVNDFSDNSANCYFNILEEMIALSQDNRKS